MTHECWLPKLIRDARERTADEYNSAAELIAVALIVSAFTFATVATCAGIL